MPDIKEKADTIYRDFATAGVTSSGRHDPKKSDVRDLFELVDDLVAVAQAGITIVSDLAARDAAFAADPVRLVYVNDNNGDPADPANGVYEYVDGAARIAEGFYQGVATVVQPLVDAAEAAAADASDSAMALDPLYKVRVAWDRPTVDAGRTARIYDLNLRRFLNWRNDSWFDDEGTEFPTPDPLLSQIAAVPVFALSMYRQVNAGYAGPFFRVKRASDATTLDCNTAAEAEEFGAGTALTVVGVFNQMDGTLEDFPTALTYATIDGLPAAYNQTAGYAELFSYSSTVGVKDNWRNVDGAWIIATVHTADVYAEATGLNGDLFFASSSTSANAARFALRTNPQWVFQALGRRLDADSAAVFTGPRMFGGISALGVAFDNANAKLTTFFNGAPVDERDWLTAGNVSDTTPASVYSRIQKGQHFFEMIAGAGALSDADYATLLADQQTAFGAWATVQDSAASAWCDPATISPDGSLALFGMSKSNGQFAVAEYDAESRDLVAQAYLESALFIVDEHNETSLRFLDDGSLVAAVVGHSNKASGTPADTNGRIGIFYSPTGRIADLALAAEIIDGAAAWNYWQWLETAETIIAITNDDNARQWVPYAFGDKDAASPERLRTIVEADLASSVFNGGSTQMYVRAAMADDSRARLVCYPHPSNSQNAFRLIELDVDTQEVFTSAGASIGDLSNAAAATLVELEDAPAIYTPAAGKSARLMTISPAADMIAGVEWDNPGDQTRATHFILIWDGVSDRFTEAAWIKRELPGDTGGGIYNTYLPWMDFAREPHRGIRVYRIRHEEVGGVDTWYLERLDSGNRGRSWRTTLLYTSTYILTRCFTPTGATDDAAVFVHEGRYVSFTQFGLRLKLFGSDPAA